ncbi:uncharacterized protein BO88DRAFT_156543 [Aspergillus vadensis CBS 113365]|uniref:Uncharacterized protein n=1 Tax=Aspergillus vadensis (strain CBS 113365 / IMI 142717 / IBT 24658) TaxID=1448311 RepID=A0A319AY99_ASPVC|nr:hypothetical protein BO88DRAFT_156543 [Aspergillus vadensis CBS 113365]PYH64584.1 hypothetical protein BO88DRAFT_156543 [Aspergillus vadensis CBS 113365]
MVDEDDDAILRLGGGRKGRKGTSDRTTTGGQQGVEGVRRSLKIERLPRDGRRERPRQENVRQSILLRKTRATLSLSSRSLTLSLCEPRKFRPPAFPLWVKRCGSRAYPRVYGLGLQGIVPMGMIHFTSYSHFFSIHSIEDIPLFCQNFPNLGVAVLLSQSLGEPFSIPPSSAGWIVVWPV